MPATRTDVFATVPDKDYMSLFDGPRPKGEEVVGFIHLKKDEIAKAAEVPLNSVRYDAKMPAELEQRLKEWGVLINLVAQHFAGDPKKTALWFTMPNPMLGNISPRDMIRFGRSQKLYKFILNAVAENQD